MPFDMQFYSKFQTNPNYKLNLEDLVPDSLKERNGFLASGHRMSGLPSHQFLNFMIMAFYDSHAFDLGRPPVYTPNSQPYERTYESDMWWSICFAAYHNCHSTDIAEHAKAIYDAFCHNYLFWTAIEGRQPTSNAFPIINLQEFESLPSYIAIRFIFLADLAKMLYTTILSSITDQQIRMYSDACMAMATMALPVYGFSAYDL